MSSFQVPVKRIRAIEAHPNADAIEFAVVDGYRSIVRKGDFASGELVAYIPEASIVPEAVIRRLGLWDAEKGKGKLSGKAGNRVSAIKLRGQISQGLCYPLISVGDMWLIDLPTDGDEPEDMADAFVLNEGDDVASLLGITKWEPEIPVSMAGEVWNAGRELTISFDIENIKSFPDILIPGEAIIMTEKLHGSFTGMTVLPLHVANLRERDARLAAARRRRVEEEHIVRMGLLASGAAHELGTPLSTLAVILGDWQHDKRLTSNAALKEDIAEMQTQVQRCKSIVSGILLSAGETRGEASVQTTVRKFVDALAEEWRSTRTIPQFDYDNDFGTDTPMVSDTTLKQMVFNVLDNARDASPGWVRLAVTRNADALCMTVTDAGPGFAPDMLSKLGTPYQSSKNRPGGGLGLYLVLNVARTLGGSVEARNRPEGGAQVTIELPLASIALPQKV